MRRSPLVLAGKLMALGAALVLAACGTTPQRSEAPAKTTTTRPKPASAVPGTVPALPPANSGRGGYYQDDGPPDKVPDDLASIPDAVPKIEPYSVPGNRPYVVFGKTYTPITDDKPFTQRGVGTWYGRKFHGQRTSSGEIYDMFKMTAAHPTLPIPSYARVVNLANGAQVIVRINDRGPFHSTRIIDLSYTAALKLGYLGSGSGMLEVQRLLPDDIRAMQKDDLGSALLDQAVDAAPPPQPQGAQPTGPVSQPQKLEDYSKASARPLVEPPVTNTPPPATAMMTPAPIVAAANAPATLPAVMPAAKPPATVAAAPAAPPASSPPTVAAAPKLAEAPKTAASTAAKETVPAASTASRSTEALNLDPLRDLVDRLASANEAERAPGFYLQFGAFGKLENAEALLARLLPRWAEDLPPVDIVAVGTLFRVFAGPFDDRAAAVRAQGRTPPGVAKPVVVQR